MALAFRLLVALLLLMVVAGPVQAADDEFRARLAAKFVSGFTEVASVLGSYLRPAETLTPANSESDPRLTYCPYDGDLKVIHNVTEFREAVAKNNKVMFEFCLSWVNECCSERSPVTIPYEKYSKSSVFANKVAFYFVDASDTIDDFVDIGLALNIPYFYTFKDGKQFERMKHFGEFFMDNLWNMIERLAAA